MGYTTAEIDAIVNKFLFTQVTVPRFEDGARNVMASRDAVYDLLTAAFLLKPDSFFYLTWLAKNRIVGLVQSELAQAQLILDSAQNLDRAVFKIETVTDLVRAETALLELGGVLNSSTSVKNTAVPAVANFRDAVESFVRTELTKNVVDGGDVVETPDEQRTKIRNAWASAKSYRTEVTNRLGYLTNAVAAFTGIRLPARTLSAVVSKMRTRISELQDVLSGSQGLEQSRQAFLELLAMRSLLTKTSEFQAPTRVAVDSLLVDRVDSPGVGPTVHATHGSPYVFAADSAFDLVEDGGAPANFSVGATEGRAVFLGTTGLSFPLATSSFDVAFLVGNLGAVAASLPASYASGPAMAAGLTTLLSGAGITVVWDSGPGRLVFRGPESLDGMLEIVEDTVDRAAFAAAIFPGVARVATVRPVPIETVLSTLNAQFTDTVAFEEGLGDIGRFVGTFTGNTLQTDPAIDLSAYWPENLDGVSVTVEVTGPTRVGGTYRAVAGASGSSTIDVDRGIAGTYDVEFTLSDRRIAVRGPGLGPDSTLEAQEDTGGKAALGLESGESYATLQGVSATGTDFVFEGARVGDRYAATTLTQSQSGTVIGVEPTRLLLDPPLPIPDTPLDLWVITVEHPAHVAYDTLVSDVTGLTPPDVTALDFLVARLLRGARLTTQAEAELEAYVDYLTDLKSALSTYAIRVEPIMASVVKTLEEQGFDRALDLLLLLDFPTVFSMDPDGVSYSTNLVRKVAQTAPAIAPQDRGAKTPFGGGRMTPVSQQTTGYDPSADS